jgi:hypothetical protein
MESQTRLRRVQMGSPGMESQMRLRRGLREMESQVWLRESSAAETGPKGQTSAEGFSSRCSDGILRCGDWGEETASVTDFRVRKRKVEEPKTRGEFADLRLDCFPLGCPPGSLNSC